VLELPSDQFPKGFEDGVVEVENAPFDCCLQSYGIVRPKCTQHGSLSFRGYGYLGIAVFSKSTPEFMDKFSRFLRDGIENKILDAPSSSTAGREPDRIANAAANDVSLFLSEVYLRRAESALLGKSIPYARVPTFRIVVCVYQNGNGTQLVPFRLGNQCPQLSPEVRYPLHASDLGSGLTVAIPPQKRADNPFFGLPLDEEQMFRTRERPALQRLGLSFYESSILVSGFHRRFRPSSANRRH